MNNNMHKNLPWALPLFALVALAVAFEFGGIGAAWALGFWAAFALDFYRTEVELKGEPHVAEYACVSAAPRGVYLDRWGFARVDWFGSPRLYEAAQPGHPHDGPCPQVGFWQSSVNRTIAYMLAAPLALPVVAYRFARSR